MKLTSGDTLTGLNALQRQEAELDLLVDAELPEERRRELLRQIATSPNGWRNLAIRFLQRQVEKQASRELLYGSSAMPHVDQMSKQKSNTMQLWTSMRTMKIAAAIMLTAGIFGSGGIYLGHRDGRQSLSGAGTISGGNSGLVATTGIHTHDGGIRMINTPLPSDIATDGNFPSQISVPVVDKQGVPAGYPFSAMGSANTPGRVVIVPEGPNQAVAFPIEEVSAKKVY